MSDRCVYQYRGALCSEPNCGRAAHARWLCKGHYDRLRRGGGAREKREEYLVCPACGDLVVARRNEQIYCSLPCANRAMARRRADRLEAMGQRRSGGEPAPLISRSCEVCATNFCTNRQGQVTCSPRCSSVRKARAKEFRKGHRRRCRHKGVPYEPIDKREVFARDRWRCGICRRKIHQHLAWPHPGAAVLDHVVPLSLPDTPGHVPANVQASHNRCNRTKSDSVGRGVQPALF